MALSFGGLQSNMGPFKPVSLKGNARINAVPMFAKHLPLTIGGVAGEDVIFGRVVSVDPDDRRHFVMGIPTGNVVKDHVLYVYYGAADQYVGLATCPLDELLSSLLVFKKV